MMNLEQHRTEQIMNVEELERALWEIHKSTYKNITALSRAQVAVHNWQVNAVQPNFISGNDILVLRKNWGIKSLHSDRMAPRSNVVSLILLATLSIGTKRNYNIHASYTLILILMPESVWKTEKSNWNMQKLNLK